MSGFLPVKQGELSNCVHAFLGAAVTTTGRSSVKDKFSFLHVTIFQSTHSCSQGKKPEGPLDNWVHMSVPSGALRIDSKQLKICKRSNWTLFFCLLSFCTHCFWCFCGQSSGRHTRLDNHAFWKKSQYWPIYFLSLSFFFFRDWAFTSYFILQSTMK